MIKRIIVRIIRRGFLPCTSHLFLLWLYSIAKEKAKIAILVLLVDLGGFLVAVFVFKYDTEAWNVVPPLVKKFRIFQRRKFFFVGAV